MIKAIVYTSNSGFTKKYAEILGKSINIPVYEFKEAKKNLNKNDEIIYMGWIMAGTIKNYKKAKSRYNVKAVCPVGMSLPSKKQEKELTEKNNVTEKLVYLQGGFDVTKLKGIYKFMMGSMEKMIKPQIESKTEKTPEDLEMLEMMNGPKDCVKKENLKEIIDWVKQ